MHYSNDLCRWSRKEYLRSEKYMNKNLGSALSSLAWVIVLNSIFLMGYNLGVSRVKVIIGSVCTILFFGLGTVYFLSKYFREKKKFNA
jgi:hypothetical protein